MKLTSQLIYILVLVLLILLLLFLLYPQSRLTSEPSGQFPSSQRITGQHIAPPQDHHMQPSNAVNKAQTAEAEADKTALLNRKADTGTRIESIEAITAMPGIVSTLSEGFDYEAASEAEQLAYLLAVNQCIQFIHIDYLKNGLLQIPPDFNLSENDDTSSSHVLAHSIKACQQVKLDALQQLYPKAAELSLNTQNTRISIQAALLLSHLPNLESAQSISQTQSNQQRIAHYKKQLMWLEHARQQGSLEALVNLAMRYQYGYNTDPVTAASYYLTLQTLAPEYELGEEVTNITGNLKTWQLEQARQNSALYVEEMKKLKVLYAW